jgi:2-aminoadipate transaminase
MTFDIAGSFRNDLPAAAAPWTDPPDYPFVGGNNDADTVPYAGLAEAAANALARHGRNLATYNLGGSPQGYLPLRTFLCDALARRADTPTDPDQVLITSGSLQALDLVNQALLAPGDTVIVEQATYGGALSRLRSCGATWHGAELDDDGIVPGALDELLSRLAADGVKPKYLYTIPTVQNPTGTVMPRARRLEILDIVRRHGIAVFEDDCYADLTWDGSRPPTFRALDGDGGQVIYCGSFSKSLAPALRVGFIVADAAVILQLLALKTDAGTGALEQLTLAEYAPSHFDDHVEQLAAALKAKCDHMVAAARREFGPAVDIRPPEGGIYIWLTFPEGVDTSSMVAAAADVGVQFNPGAEWSADPTWGSRRLRLCFGDADPTGIDAGVAALAKVYRQTYPTVGG